MNFIVVGTMVLVLAILILIICLKVALNSCKRYKGMYEDVVKTNEVLKLTVKKLKEQEKIRNDERRKADEKIASISSGSGRDQFDAINNVLQDNSGGDGDGGARDIPTIIPIPTKRVI